MTSLRLDGRKVLVTGAGRGLGRAIADDLQQNGATVFGTSRSSATAAEIAERYGTPALVLDLLDPGTCDAFVESLGENAVDTLINNAGVNIPRAAVQLTPDDWQTVLSTNLTGPFLLSTAFARRWLRDDIRGCIVNIASQAGIVAIEERAAYGASKAGLIQLTKNLALEWASVGIRVNAVAPTFIRTELTESTLSRVDWAADLLSRIPLGRFGEPADVVGAVAFLASDAASLVTGHTITIDGGYTIR